MTLLLGAPTWVGFGRMSSHVVGWNAGTEDVAGVMDDGGIGADLWRGLLFILYERTK